VIEIPTPAKGDRILYRHGRADLPYGTPDVVPGTVYALAAEGECADTGRSGDQFDDAVVSVLAHDALGQPIIVRGRVGEPAHRLPRAAFCMDAGLRGTWCYAPGLDGRAPAEVPDLRRGRPGDL
jgi:hypothetical protein